MVQNACHKTQHYEIQKTGAGERKQQKGVSIILGRFRPMWGRSTCAEFNFQVSEHSWQSESMNLSNKCYYEIMIFKKKSQILRHVGGGSMVTLLLHSPWVPSLTMSSDHYCRVHMGFFALSINMLVGGLVLVGEWQCELCIPALRPVLSGLALDPIHPWPE